MDTLGLGVPSPGRGDVLPLPDRNPLILLVLRCCKSRVNERADTDDLHLDGTDLSPAFPAFLASPVISHRNNSQSLIPCPSGTGRHTHYRWENLPPRGATADHYEDRRGSTLHRGADQSHS